MHGVTGSSGRAVMVFEGMGSACRSAGRGGERIIAGSGAGVGGSVWLTDVSFGAVRGIYGLLALSGME